MWNQVRRRWPASVTTALLLSLLAGVAAPGRLRAQQPARTAVDSLRSELTALRAELDTLRARLGAAEQAELPGPAGRRAVRGAPHGRGGRGGPPGDALARLRAAAAAAAAEADTATAPPTTQAEPFVGRQRALQALNPEISVGGDLFARAATDEPGRDNFVMRELEFAFQAVLDPYSRAKVILARGEPGAELAPFAAEGEEPGDAEIDVEEAYLQWVNMPGGLGLTVGRFRQRLGTYNRLHGHALPWQQLPLPYVAFLGDEGLAQTGASVYWLLPVHGAGTYEAWIEATRSGNEAFFGDSHEANVLAHFNAFWDFSSSYFELGASGLVGRYEANGAEATNRLLHLEAGYNWRPPGRELYRELTLRGALIWNRRSAIAGVGDGTASEALGGFAFAEYRMAQRWLAGVRADYTEDPFGAGTHAWAVVPTLTWWQSEFVRIRAEYDHLRRPAGATGQFLLQFTFAMGPHKHETY